MLTALPRLAAARVLFAALAASAFLAAAEVSAHSPLEEGEVHWGVVKHATANTTVNAEATATANATANATNATLPVFAVGLLRKKPEGDPRLYQHARFDNGLEMVNIHDAGSTQAAFAVAVTSGSFYDYSVEEHSVRYLGLAHLTEHALFLGTKSFPRRSGFDEFLADHGGSSNAYTAEEATVFFADLSAGAFEEGLQRFADFFNAPLLDPLAIWEEVNAVNSEHSKNQQSPAWQTSRVMYSLASPSSPLQWFHTGDKATLERGGRADLAAAVRAYFDANFCPPRMHLVTFGPHTVEHQMSSAATAFGSIPRLGRKGACSEKPRNFTVPAPFDSSRLGQFLHVLGGSPQLWMLFPLDSLKPWQTSHPIMYIKYLIGFGAPGSLQTTLRDELGLAYGVSLWSEDTSAGTMVWVVADLMDRGADHPDAVLDTIFAYLEHAWRQGINGDALKSLVRATQLQWEWSPLPDPMNAASKVAEEMTRLSPSELLSADSLVEHPNATRILEVLKKLQPSGMNLCFIDPMAEKTWDPTLTVHTLPFYGVRYTVSHVLARFPRSTEWGTWPKDITEKTRLALAMVDTSLGARLHRLDPSIPEAPPMSLPGAILDLPGKLTLDHAIARKGYGELGIRWGEAPALLDSVSKEKGDLYFRQGWMLPRPRVVASFDFRSHITDSEAPTADLVVLEVAMRILNEQMSQALDNLGQAGASWSVSLWTRGMGATFGAYSSTMQNISRDVLREFNRGIDETNVKRCSRIVDGFYSELRDYSAQPLKQAIANLDVLLFPGAYSKAELLEAMDADNIDCEKAARAIEKGRKGAFAATALVMGSCTEEEARDIRSLVLRDFRADVSLQAQDVERVGRVVKPGVPVELRARNPRDGDRNHVMVLQVLVGEATVEKRVLLGLVGSMLSQIVFAELRTRQQLGYIVGGDVSSMSNVLTVSCYVQGERMLPDEVEAQCENIFATTVPRTISNLTEAALASQKTAYRNSVLQKPMSNAEEANHFEGMLLLGSCFNLEEQLLSYLDRVTSRQQLLDAWNEAVLPSEGLRRKVVVKYWGSGHRPSEPPSADEAAHLVLLAGASEAAAQRARQERNATMVVDVANSTTRAALVKSGGFFSRNMSCQLAAAGANASDRASGDAAGGSHGEGDGSTAAAAALVEAPSSDRLFPVPRPLFPGVVPDVTAAASSVAAVSPALPTGLVRSERRTMRSPSLAAMQQRLALDEELAVMEVDAEGVPHW